MNKQEILRVEDLNLYIHTQKGTEHILKDINFSICKGMSLGIVGQSGSGKTLTALTIMGMLPVNATVTSGKILFMGRDLLRVTQSEMDKIRGDQVAMIFQNPMTALNPVYKIRTQIVDIINKRGNFSKYDIQSYILQLLESVGLGNSMSVLNKYPHELSGGMLQRILIAMVIACRPRLLIADEPTSALDPTIRNYILELINTIRNDINMDIIVITHDLAVVEAICTDVIVINDGTIVEAAKIDEILYAPKHEYTRQLVNVSRESFLQS